MATPGNSRPRMRFFKPLLRIGLSAAALGWVLARTPLRGALELLRETNIALLAGGVLLNVLTRLPAAERTFVMSRALGMHISRAQTVKTLLISNFYGLLSPGPLLSSAVTVYRYRKLGAALGGSISTLLASRAVEAFAFLFWGSVLILCDLNLRSTQIPLAWRHLAAAGLGVGLGALGLWLAAERSRRRPRPAAKPGEEPAIGWRQKLQKLWRQLRYVGPRAAFEALLPATLQLVLSGAAMALIARSVGCELPWESGVWICAAVYVATLLPISVAGIGVRELTLVKCFALLGLSPRPAIAVGILLLADQLVVAALGAALQTLPDAARARPRGAR
jgi:glycosyltransferase 2 family protein